MLAHKSSLCRRRLNKDRSVHISNVLELVEIQIGSVADQITVAGTYQKGNTTVPKPDDTYQITANFSLRKVANLLVDYEPPPIGDFDPSGQWKQEYAMFALLGPARPTGEFSIERAASKRQGCLLKVATRRTGNSGFSQFQRAELQCQNDALATPTSWVFDTKMARDPDGPPYLQSGRRRNANVANGLLTLHDKWRTSNTRLNGPYSTEWALLDAVQRLSGARTREMHYTLINEYDTPLPGHKLGYWNTAEVTLRSGTAKLTSYVDIGPGVVPTVYWVDEHHRLLFVCSGIMVYALRMTNGQLGNCPKHYPEYKPEKEAGPSSRRAKHVDTK